MLMITGRIVTETVSGVSVQNNFVFKIF